MDARRKRLLFRTHHCGMKENDVLLGGFADARIKDLSDDQLDQLEALLDESDNDLYNWITGKTPVPAALDCDVTRMLQDFIKTL